MLLSPNGVCAWNRSFEIGHKTKHTVYTYRVIVLRRFFMPKLDERQERTWGMGCHLASLAGFIIPFGNIIGPLVLWLIKRDESEFVNDQGKESLNFQITVTILAIVSGILIIVLIGIFLLVLVGVFSLVMIILATIKASEGEKYRYPFNIRLIK